MYQKTSRTVFKCLKAVAVFILSLVLLLPTLSVMVNAADECDIQLDVPYFNQGDYTSYFKYPDGSTVWSRNDKTNEIVCEAYVAISGCGAASGAMVVDYYRGANIVDPEDMFQRAVDKYYYEGHGLTHDAVSYICSLDSVNVSWSSSISDAINAIKDGRPVIANMGPGTFTSYGHYIVLIGYKKDSNGNEFFLVNDPNHPSFCGREFTRSTITSEAVDNGYGITTDTAVKSLTISPAMDTTTLKSQKSCNITGYVASNAKLTEVTGQILTPSGSEVQAITVNPNSSYLDLKSSDVNMELKFGTLSDGSYTLKITAKDANNKTDSKTISFMVGDSPIPVSTTSTLAINSLSLDATKIIHGKVCNINGSVSSNYAIQTVKGEILDGNGKAVQTITIKPNSKYLNIRTSDVNMNLKFGKLEIGSYKLKITASDSQKSVNKTIDFKVVDSAPIPVPSSTLTIKDLSTSLNPVPTGNSCNVLGTVSSNFEIKKIVGTIVNSSGKTVQTATITPNTKYVELKTSGINANLIFGKLSTGGYTLTVTATDSLKSVSSSYSFTVQNTSPDSTLSISSLRTECNPITKGNACNILGAVTSNYSISKVVGEIISSTGIKVQSVTITPNTKSVDLKSTDINLKLSLGTLSAGPYTLKVTATDAKKSISSSYSFTVKNPDPPSTLAISSLKTESNPIAPGNSCNILGTVSSNYNITKIVGTISTTTGTLAQSVTITPNAKSVDLKTSGINAKLTFGTLSAGTYILTVTATDAKSATATKAYSFTVKNPDPASTLTISSLKTESNPIIAGNACNVLGNVSSNYTISKIDGYIISNTGSKIQSVSIDTNSKSIDLKSSDINTKLSFGKLVAGNYTLQVTATDAKKSVSSSYSFSVKNPDPASTLSISLGMDSTTITTGSSCNVTGTVSSNYTISTITGVFINSSGTKVQTVTINPNKSSVDLKSSDINSKLAFGILSAGNYTLQITATDAKKSVSSSKSFTIKNPDPASTLAISSVSPDGTTITAGSSYNITGTVSSNYNITNVTASFVNSSLVKVQTVSITPNSKSVDLKSSNINLKLAFGNLSTGNYSLVITATDEKKTVSISKTFTIKNADPDSTLAISSLSPENITIPSGSSYNVTGTVSSNYNIISITGSFINSSGTTVQSVTINPNSKTVDLKSTDINYKLAFGKLAAGNYTLKVTATDAKKSVTSSKSFTIQGASVAGLSGSVSMATTSVSYGSGCNITGSFSSGSKITSVVGKIINSSGTVVQSQTIYPNSTSVDLKSSAINSNLRFGTLARGGYSLSVTATDAAGHTLTRTVTFSVK
ncbi:MAG: C39 family peptidase [Lachnospiraceae bacterium]|nr:C39 family peptidase [Lachnospiraceae bacterium]